MIDFTSIEYLRTGNERQKKAYAVLTEGKIFDDLRKYNPILTGTIPIEIDLPESDLDIICECSDQEEFYQCIVANYSEFADFKIEIKKLNGIESTIASFKLHDFEIEIFGQNVPSFKQDAYRHLLIEYQILREKGAEFREEILKLKSQGLKTEPAFAQLLQLKGNPYLELLKYEKNF
jgi:hypothetical protein